MRTSLSRTAVGPAQHTANRLLSALASQDIELLEPDFSVWTGAAGQILFDAGDPVDFSYFPCGATLASFRILFFDGGSVETALVGCEGAIGGIVSQGRLPAFARAIVQHPGHFIRINSTKLEEAKTQSWAIRNLFARYSDCLLSQVFQATACNAAHTIDQRTAKWLLAALDRTGSRDVPLTQEQLAGMLGVGRSYINRLIRIWKAKGILEWRRGGLTVSNVDALRERECACNSAVRAHFDAVLAGVYP